LVYAHEEYLQLFFYEQEYLKH